ncbi:hypothetical protein KR018_009057 [Drosophila ironensis]|nr:hypothetical protein KR018_009057 [Drosophila ironensis]
MSSVVDVCRPLTVLGLGALMFLGYCAYFDRKRRANPNYKRLVHERRQRRRAEMEDRAREAVPPSLTSGDQAALEKYFLSEIKTGEELISEGHLDEGLDHLANAISLCAQPAKLLEMLQNFWPGFIFPPLVAKLLEIRRRK